MAFAFDLPVVMRTFVLGQSSGYAVRVPQVIKGFDSKAVPFALCPCLSLEPAHSRPRPAHSRLARDR